VRIGPNDPIPSNHWIFTHPIRLELTDETEGISRFLSRTASEPTNRCYSVIGFDALPLERSRCHVPSRAGAIYIYMSAGFIDREASAKDVVAASSGISN
jgi:hypothetical protein